MAYTAVAQSSIEPVGHNVWEIVANIANYNVISGCALTYNVADLTVNMALGVITHNGLIINVAAQVNAVTLVPDPLATNPLWAWIGVNSAGTAVLVTGTAAANPSVPSLANNVAVALVRVEAGATIANNQVYKLDKRIFRPGGAVDIGSGWFHFG